MTVTTNSYVTIVAAHDVANEIRITGNINMQNCAISNAVYSGTVGQLYVPPQGGLSMGTFTNGLPQ